MHETQFSRPFARSNGEYTSSPVIEYAAVRIHDTEYWLPQSKSVEFLKVNGHHSFSYISHYSDYHKFEASARITEIDEVK